jgi:pyrroline-5-carboxylate reductase
MRINKRIGIIGCGNMGGAILAGLLKRGIVRSSQITVYDKIVPKAQALASRWKVRPGDGNADVVDRSDILVLAVKPQDLFDAASEFRQAFKARHLLITILAGTPIAKVRRAVGPKPAVVRAMPNLGAQVGEAMTALSGTGPANLALAETVFSGCGKTIRLSERYFDLVTAISGSGPAYFFLLMELLSKEARSHGLSEKVARELAVQTALGAALLAQNSDLAPAELRKQVTSKGGTTEAALRVFEKEGLPAIVSKGLQAALRRGRELSRS